MNSEVPWFPSGHTQKDLTLTKAGSKTLHVQGTVKSLNVWNPFVKVAFWIELSAENNPS